MAGTNYQLTMQVGPDPGKVFPLDKPDVVIGRDLNADIVINDAEVSRKHAHMVAQQGGYVIEDLGSTNGTVVNGLRLSRPYLLRVGEEINLGEHVSLVYDAVQFDPDATQVAPTATPQRPPATVVEPPPPQLHPTPAKVTSSPMQNCNIPEEPPLYPAPDFSEQEPVNPAQVEPAPAKRRVPTWLMIVIILLILMCLCGAISVWVIDSNNLWCTLFPFLPGCP